MPPRKPPNPSFSDPWALERAQMMHDRLAAVGATQDEIDAFVDQFVHDPTFAWEEKQRVVALGDGKLRAEVLRARADGLRDTETADEEAARVAAGSEALAAVEVRAEAERMSAYEPRQILDWVGTSVERARAALTVEEDHPEARASLIAGLLRVVDANR